MTINYQFGDVDAHGATIRAAYFRVIREKFDSEAKLSWILAGLAGLLVATAFCHSAGYFPTLVTGNAQRVVLGFFRNEQWLSLSAALLLVAFLGGVVSASMCRRHIWSTRPHGATVLTTLALAVGTVLDLMIGGGPALPLLPIGCVTFGIGALNTTFVKDGEVSIPLSYVTGTLVKMGQGIESHINGGELTDWLGHLLLFAAFTAGAGVGGCISLVAGGAQMLGAAGVACALTTAFTYPYADRHTLCSDWDTTVEPSRPMISR